MIASLDGTTRHAVGLGGMAISRAPGDVLAAYGVGSCVILCAWDGLARVAGMAHIVQPRSPENAVASAWYADAAVPTLVGHLRSAGATAARLVVKMAGGASLLQPAQRADRQTIGDLNARAVQDALAGQGLRLAASDLGGAHGRTVLLDVASGRVVVKTLGQGETRL